MSDNEEQEIRAYLRNSREKTEHSNRLAIKQKRFEIEHLPHQATDQEIATAIFTLNMISGKAFDYIRSKGGKRASGLPNL